jgi:hypothetical protein
MVNFQYGARLVNGAASMEDKRPKTSSYFTRVLYTASRSGPGVRVFLCGYPKSMSCLTEATPFHF